MKYKFVGQGYSIEPETEVTLVAERKDLGTILIANKENKRLLGIFPRNHIEEIE
jgi:hypothetical protein